MIQHYISSILQITVRFQNEMQPLVSKYLGACFSGLLDRNNIVRKYYASAIGHLVGIAKVKNPYTHSLVIIIFLLAINLEPCILSIYHDSLIDFLIGQFFLQF